MTTRDVMLPDGTLWTDPEYIIVDSEEKLADAFADLAGKRAYAFDCETTSLDYEEGEVWGLGLCADHNKAYYFHQPYANFAIDWAKPRFEDRGTWTIGWNLPFDWHYINKTVNDFIDIKVPIDAMVMAWLVDENQELGLKPQAEHWFGEEDLIEFKDLQWEAKNRLKEEGIKANLDDIHIREFNQDRLAYYGAKDALLTYRLYAFLHDKLVEEEMQDIFYTWQVPFTKVLTEMEETGLWVDLEKMYALREEVTAEHEKALKEWEEFTEGVNPRSTQQLQKYFYEDLGCPVTLTTKKGKKPATSALAIQRLSFIEKSKVPAEILLRVRQADKLLSTYIEPIIIKAEANGGWLRAGFNQTGTVTGRLSSSGPNLQNIPVRTELGRKIREALGAPAGYLYIGIDYSQIELRLICHYSSSPTMLQVFTEDGDPHQTTATLVNVARHIGKTINFAWAYGSGARTLCNTIEENGYERPKEADAKGWLNSFSDAYPELNELKRAIVMAASRRGFVKTLMGRKRRLPEINHPDFGARGRSERQAVNSVIQGSVGDLMLYAMVSSREKLRAMGAKFCIQVHDEVGVLVPEDKVEQVAEYVKGVMESVEHVFKLRVPIVAEPKFDRYWGFAK